MDLSFEPIAWPPDAGALIEFLTVNDWPFHGRSRLTPEQAAAVQVIGDDIESFWICDGGARVGLLRAFDLDDLHEGSPLFDIRIADGHRGRGVGTYAVEWLTSHLFESHPALHRIEATTRHDNVAMQSVFDRCGYRQEGRFVEAWLQDDGNRFDSLAYAILRREWVAAINPSRPRRPWRPPLSPAP